MRSSGRGRLPTWLVMIRRSLRCMVGQGTLTSHSQGDTHMAIATRVLDLHLLTWNGLVKCQVSQGASQATVVGTQLEGENMRAICQDPLNPRRLYACSVTDVY